MTKPVNGNARSVQSSTSSHQTQHPKKKVDKRIQNVFDELSKNNKQAIEEHEQFMQDMFGDDSARTTQKSKKKVNSKTQKVYNEIDKNHKQADKEHDQFMKDMFGDVL